MHTISLRSAQKIKNHGTSTNHVPELVLNGFGTRLGLRQAPPVRFPGGEEAERLQDDCDLAGERAKRASLDEDEKYIRATTKLN
jgi:hypothetical protein